MVRIGVALLVVALFTSMVAPFAASAESTSVDGTVTDVDTGNPIQGATVSTWDGQKKIKETTTDSEGYYSLDAENATRIEVSADGYDNQSRTYEGNSTEDFELGSTPRYEFTLAAGDAYAIGVPGPIEADTVGDLFDPFKGVIYGYDSTDGWHQVRHGDQLESLEALVVVVDADAQDVQVTMTFEGTAGVDDGTPPSRELDDGWNFVSPPQSDADAAFDQAEEILDQGYAEPQSSQVESGNTFQRETLGNSELRVNPFKGYFVRTDGGATVEAEAHTGITRTMADGLLALGSGSLEGTVTNGSGSPIADATVYVNGVNETTTDADGNYSVGSVPAGLNTVTVEAEGHAPGDRAVAIRVNERATADVTVVKQPAIEGRVTDAKLSADAGIENATVVVERRTDNGSVETVETTRTNATGHYGVHVPRNETYNVSVEASDHVDESNRTVEVGQDDVTESFALEPLDGEVVGTVSDAVLAENDSIAGVEVVLTNSSDELNVTTDENGTFSVVVAAHEEYTVEFNASDHVDETTNVTAGANETVDRSRALEPRNATISGNITDAGTGAAVDTATVNVTNGSQQWSTGVNADGSYELEVPPHQTYTVTADADDYVPADATAAVGAGKDYRNGSQVREFALIPLGSISGTIGGVNGSDLTDASGDPVRATITIEDQNGSYTNTTETAAGGGDYTFEDLETDTTYNLTVSAPDHVPVETTVHLPASEPDRTGESYDLREGGYLFGDVVDYDADPVAGASVTIIRPNATNETVVTDSNGEFETPVVPTGSYVVLVEADGYSGRTFDRNITQGGSDTRFPLVADASIEGTVTDAEIGDPIEDATVIAVDADGNEYRTSNLTTDGNYSLTVPGEADYQVRANASDHFESANLTVQVDSGETNESNDFALEPRNATIDGDVTDAKLGAGAAIANATVTVEEADGMPLTGFSTTVETDENGRYAVEVPPHAEYNVSVAAPDHENGGPKTRTVGAGEEYAGGSEMANFSLTPLPTDVEGTVTDAKLESDDAIVGANVTVYRVDDSGSTLVEQTQTDSSGAYLVEDVAPHETYRVTISAADHVDPEPVEAPAGAGEAYEGGPVVENFSLAPLDGSISGTLTDSQTGEPIVGATVTAYKRNSSLTRNATTDENGSYTITDVPAHNEYDVYGDDEDYEFDPTNENHLVTVNVGANESVGGVALQLDPKPANVTGVVTDAENGSDLEGVTVTVYQSSALDMEVANDTTGAGGRYKVTGVPADGSNYTVEFDAPNHENAQTGSFTPDANDTIVRNASLVPLDGVIEGLVTDNETGDTVAATVWITSEDGEVDSQSTSGTLTEGEYSFSGVNASKNWTITVEADGYKVENVTQFLSANGEIQKDFQLEPKDGTVSGTVDDAENNTAIEGATVTVEGDGFTETVQTNASGQYEVSVPTPADYNVTVEVDGYLSENATVQVDSGGSATQDFSLQPAGYVFGKVTDRQGKELENVAVTIYVTDDLGNEEVIASASTDANGDYETDLFQTGDYQIRFEKSGYKTVERNVTVAQGANEEDEIMEAT